MPVHGNLLECFEEGRLEIGAGTLFEPEVWITAPGEARVRIGEGCFLNLGVMVAVAWSWSRSATTACSPTAAS